MGTGWGAQTAHRTTRWLEGTGSLAEVGWHLPSIFLPSSSPPALFPGFPTPHPVFWRRSQPSCATASCEALDKPRPSLGLSFSICLKQPLPASALDPALPRAGVRSWARKRAEVGEIAGLGGGNQATARGFTVL